jgi:hypothetical protein
MCGCADAMFTSALRSKGEQMRRWIANQLVRLARRIHPENEEAMRFWMDRMVEMAVTGKSIIKVSAVDPSQDAAVEQGDKG